jgi:putative N6-adenine-specific DNA methylase
MDCLAVCAPGLEALVRAELEALGVRPGRTIRGGVTFTATTRRLYAANVWLRTASRVLVRVAQFRAATFAALERHADEIDWSPWLGDGVRPAFRVASHASRLYHTGAIAERLARSTGGHADAASSASAESSAPGSDRGDGAPEQLVVVRVARDLVTVSVDASGAHLHRRGWRRTTAKAPLRETLAAAMVTATGWDGAVPLVDPLCGSGTVAVEAALAASGRAPGRSRSFAFEQWPSFEPGTWASVRADVARADRAAADATVAPIVAADRDAGAVRAARDNAARAGVGDLVEVRQAPIAETLSSLPSPPGWIVTNPPYGARVGGGDLRDLYATLGRAPGWRVGLLAADRALAGHLGRPLAEAFRTTNGGIPVTFWTAPSTNR